MPPREDFEKMMEAIEEDGFQGPYNPPVDQPFIDVLGASVGSTEQGWWDKLKGVSWSKVGTKADVIVAICSAIIGIIVGVQKVTKNSRNLGKVAIPALYDVQKEAEFLKNKFRYSSPFGESIRWPIEEAILSSPIKILKGLVGKLAELATSDPDYAELKSVVAQMNAKLDSVTSEV